MQYCDLDGVLSWTGYCFTLQCMYDDGSGFMKILDLGILQTHGNSRDLYLPALCNGHQQQLDI